MLSILIEAYKKRNFVTIDMNGAFLKAKIPEDVKLIVKMEGELAELMCELDLRYKMNERGLLYLECVKALYGHIKVARLFYKDLNESLIEKMGFKQNQYDPRIIRE
jgi:hypothetical protein